MSGFQIVFMAVLLLAGLVILVMLATLLRFFRLWLQCTLSNAPVPMMQLIGMKFRRIDPKTIVQGYLRARKAGLVTSTAKLEEHYLAGGRVLEAVTAAVADNRVTGKDRVDLWCEVDLAGYDVMDAANKLAAGKLAMDKFSIEALRRAGVQRRYDQ